jgi:peptidyl-prolyl cis-trans isomerase C
MRCRHLAMLVALTTGCAPQSTASTVPDPPPSLPDAPTAEAEPTTSHLITLLLMKTHARMVDCGHGTDVGPLRCAYKEDGTAKPTKDDDTLHTFVTEPPSLLLAASDWRPAQVLGGHEVVAAECEFEVLGSFDHVHVGATEGLRGYLYDGAVRVVRVTDCAFEPRPAPPAMAAAHVLVSHADAPRSPAKRTRQEALARARQAAEALGAGGDFAVAVSRYSDEPRAAERAGRLGTITPGVFAPEFVFGVLATPIGRRSPVVESSFGFHIIERQTR